MKNVRVFLALLLFGMCWVDFVLADDNVPYCTPAPQNDKLSTTELSASAFPEKPLLHHPSKASKRSAVEEEDFDEGDEPPAAIPGVETTYGACLERKGDRLVVAGGSTNPPKAVADGIEHYIFIASDLCAMGHTTKDPAHLASWMLDLHEERQKNEQFRKSGKKVRLTLLYGNQCMTKDASNRANKRTPVFHNVLLGWFRAIMKGGIHTRTSAAKSKSDPSAVMEAVSETFDIEAIEEVYYEDITRKMCPSDAPKVLPGAPPPVTGIVKRFEHWRWLRNRHHTNLFRQSILEFYDVIDDAGRSKVSLDDPTANPRQLRITVLRRDEDRHFEETKVYNMLRTWMPKTIQLSATEKRDPKLTRSKQATDDALMLDVQLVTFDNIKGKKGKPPPPHPEQLRILHETDILVAAHGAGLAGIIAMRPGAAVIELFPHNFRYYMYQELAQLADLLYIPFESPVVHPPRCCSGRGQGNTMPEITDGNPSTINGVGARACKKCDIKVTEHEWRSMLRTCVNHVLRSRGYSSGGSHEDLPVFW